MYQSKIVLYILLSLFFLKVYANPESFSLIPATQSMESSLLVPSTAALNESSVVAPSEIEIGEAIFESKGDVIKKARQVGVAFEERPNLTAAYLFYNELLPNNLFYEVRVYAGYNYQTNNPFVPGVPLVQTTVPFGYGALGLLGYVIPLNDDVTLMPLVRVSAYRNFLLAYNGGNGNSIDSNTYMIQPGATLSMKVTPKFAFTVGYWLGYEYTPVYGSGIYASSEQQTLSGLITTLQFSLPYKVSQDWSVVPYFQYNTNAVGPNDAMKDVDAYNAKNITLTNLFFGLKLNYAF